MNWQDSQEIGVALARHAPWANHLTVSDVALASLVRTLPGFNGPPQPPDPLVLSAIGFAWIAAIGGPDDDNPFDHAA